MWEFPSKRVRVAVATLDGHRRMQFTVDRTQQGRGG
jgi:hypothetical protein